MAFGHVAHFVRDHSPAPRPFQDDSQEIHFQVYRSAFHAFRDSRRLVPANGFRVDLANQYVA